ncbi:MAG: hypothetical protein N2749_04735 [Clostridia bacterium]|nr:hypothetical protein [Clostridia bacterium]
MEVHINILNYVPTIIVPILNFKKKALKINRDHNKYEVVTFKWLSRFTRHNGLIKKIENSKLVLEYDPFSIRVGLNPIIRSSELIREYFRNMTNYIDMLYIEIAPGLYAFAKNYSSDECLIVNASGEWSIVTLQKIFDYYLESMIQPLHEQAKSSTMALKIATENFKQYDSSNSIFDNYIL